jgi:transposase
MLINANCRPRRKRLSWESRCEIVAKVVERGLSPEQAAACSGVHRATVYRLLARFAGGGWEALKERPSTPKHQPRRLAPELEAEIVAVLRRTLAGPQVVGAIVGRAASTVGKVLRRLGDVVLPLVKPCPLDGDRGLRGDEAKELHVVPGKLPLLE